MGVDRQRDCLIVGRSAQFGRGIQLSRRGSAIRGTQGSELDDEGLGDALQAGLIRLEPGEVGGFRRPGDEDLAGRAQGDPPALLLPAPLPK